MATLGARLIHSSPFHPQTCGKVERHHQTLKKWLAHHGGPPATLAGLQALLDTYQDHYNTRRHHSAVGGTPRHAWDTAPAYGGPGHLPRQDDATIHQLLVGANGTIHLGDRYAISIGRAHTGTTITVIRDHDRITAYTPSGDPIGHLHLNHTRKYQGSLTPAA